MQAGTDQRGHDGIAPLDRASAMLLVHIDGRHAPDQARVADSLPAPEPVEDRGRQERLSAFGQSLVQPDELRRPDESRVVLVPLVDAVGPVEDRGRLEPDRCT